MAEAMSFAPPSAPTSVPLLNEQNYNTWKYQMQARLMQSTVAWLVVNGTFTQPATTEAENLRAWQVGNLQGAGLIFNAVSPNLHPFIFEHLDNAKLMWTTLKDKFSQQNATSRFIILNDFLNIQKQPEESLSALIGRVDTSLQALRASKPADFSLTKLEEELAYSSLIRALPEEFHSFRSSLLLVNGDAITYSKVKQAFLQEEQARSSTAAEMTMKAGSSSSAQGKRTRGARSNKSSFTPCTYPGCKSQNKSRHSTECCFTKQKDEAATKVKELERRLEKAKIAEETPSENMETAEFAGNASAFDYIDPHSPLITDAGADWNADTGATRHMTPHRHWFHSYTPYRVAIRLADHKVIHSTGCGSVRFQPVINGKPQCLLEFHDVLHVPALRSNLLSVLYLTRNKLYNVHIDSVRISFKQGE